MASVSLQPNIWNMWYDKNNPFFLYNQNQNINSLGMAITFIRLCHEVFIYSILNRIYSNHLKGDESSNVYDL